LERNVGYAWVPSSHASEGTPVEVASPAGIRPSTVARLPFVDADKRIPVA
jgi:glycine cleavage system aminomethyltransferase T